MSTRYGLALALALAGVLSTPARAALFEDDEARRAIIELRQRIDTLQQSNQRAGDDLRRSGEDTSQMRRSLLDLQSQIESLHVELAKLRGQNEQLGRDVSELQRLQKETAQGVNERLKKFEPGKVTLDGQEFVADPKSGSKHNRGCAVDLTMYDLATGTVVQMPGEYDEPSLRSYPDYTGGAPEARAKRDLLRAVMERQGFTVEPNEWWHFNYKDWPSYPILDISFQQATKR